MNQIDIEIKLKEVLRVLFDKDCSSLKQYCTSDYMKPEYLISEINDYPGEICLPPESAYNIYEELNIEEYTKSIWFNLWFDQKESDLILEIRLKESKPSVIETSIQNLRVM